MELTFWGDLSFGLKLAPLAQQQGFDFFFENIKPLLLETEANIVSFDCTITETTKKNPLRDGSHLKTSPQAARAMGKAGIKLAPK